MKPNQNASASLSVQNPDKHYTFLMQKSQNCVHGQVSTISKHYTFPITVNHIKTLHFAYQNCVHIGKCPPYQNTTLCLSKLRPYRQVSTISKHYPFPITVHHIKTLHFPYQNCVHIGKWPPYQNTTLFP